MTAKKKSAELSAGLVAVKGAAMPVPSSAMPTRAAETTPAEAPDAEAGPGLAPLNFRVSAAFRREFKTFAAQHDLKLNELLRRSFEVYRQKEG